MIFSPGAWLAALCALGAVLLWIRPRSGRILVCLGAAGFLAVALLPIDQWLLEPLENRFPQPPADARVAGIIVLGGALDTALTADRDLPSLNPAAERLTHLVALALSRPDLPILFTGGPAPNQPYGPPETLGVKILLRQLGVPEGRVQFEAASRTTWENAVMSKDLIHPKPGDIWLLVTSAAHMPRSIGTFRAAGWTVLADPVGYKSFRHPADRGRRGFGERLWLIDTAMHEWFGLVQYTALGRSSALFPAP